MGTESSRSNQSGTNRTLKGVLASLFILLLVAAALILIDPFAWHLVDRMRGRYDPALTAIPAGSHVYLGVNLVSTNLVRLDELLETFSTATAGTELDSGMFRQELETWLAEQLDLSLSEDVAPWIGQHIGLALVTVEVNEFGETTQFDWLLTAETRDEAASDQFLEDLATGWSESSQESPVTETYEGVLLTQFKRFAFGRSRRLVLAGSSANVLQQAIAAQNGESLAADPSFQEAIGQLPADRSLTTYVNGPQLNKVLANLPTPLPRISPENLPTAPIQAVALGLSLADEGIRLDSAAVYDAQQLSLLQRTALETHVVTPETASLFPADTVLYLVGQGVDLVWASLRRALIAEIGRADFTDSMRLFAQEFNINPDEELFPLLDGEAALGLHPGRLGMASGEAAVNLAATLLIGSGDPETLSANIAALSDQIGDPQRGFGRITISQAEAGYMTYEFETALVPDLLLTYGVDQKYLMISSSAEALASLRHDGGRSLAERPDYQRVWQAFPEGMAPGLFVDVAGLLAVLQEGGAAAAPELATLTGWLSPFSYIAMAGQVDDHISHNTLILFIKPQ